MYIDGFVFPVAEAQLQAYKEMAYRVARISKPINETLWIY